jgi:nicotinate phosphoribosyltransferase
VYKLSAIRKSDGSWEHKVKISEQAAKITNPGILQVRRFRTENEFVGDAIYDLERGLAATVTIVDPLDMTRRKHFGLDTAYEDLLVPICRQGKVVYQLPTLDEIRARVQQQLGMLHPGIKRSVNPHQYPAGLELALHELKMKLVLRSRGKG